MIKNYLLVLILLFFAGIGIYSLNFVKNRSDYSHTSNQKEQNVRLRAENCYVEIEPSGEQQYFYNVSGPFCSCMGGRVFTEDDKQKGYCEIDGDIYEAWEYFNQMNPWDNRYTPSPRGTEAWKICYTNNADSVYCSYFQG